MTARILVVDDLLPNIKLLEARLNAEYFDVLTATTGQEALAICAEGHCDIVLLDVMMPGMDGFEVCRRLKSDPLTAHLPVVMVTALDQPADRLKGLQAGADDFLTKPVDEIALIARVRSLARFKVVIDELRLRASTSASMGLADTVTHMLADQGNNARILLVDDRPSSIERITGMLSKDNEVLADLDAQEALFRVAEGGFDLMIVSLGLKDYDGLRLCSQIRSLERTRNMPMLILAEPEDRPRVLRGLDMGVNDYLMRPIDRNELLARVRMQVRRKRYADSLRDNVQASIELAVVDPLTGLNNRRFLERHLTAMLAQAHDRARPLAMMIIDIDHFKLVNDTYGHDAGDEVLKGVGARIKGMVRGADLICRLGGEEFVVVMPGTGIDVAEKIAERIRAAVHGVRFTINPGGEAIQISISIGVAERGPDANAEFLYKRADRALYRAKNSGRNQVSADAA